MIENILAEHFIT